jgi:hypothetical protein
LKEITTSSGIFPPYNLADYEGITNKVVEANKAAKDTAKNMYFQDSIFFIFIQLF